MLYLLEEIGYDIDGKECFRNVYAIKASSFIEAKDITRLHWKNVVFESSKEDENTLILITFDKVSSTYAFRNSYADIYLNQYNCMLVLYNNSLPLFQEKC